MGPELSVADLESALLSVNHLGGEWRTDRQPVNELTQTFVDPSTGLPRDRDTSSKVSCTVDNAGVELGEGRAGVGWTG